MKILEVITNDNFPFNWANLNNLPDSNAKRKEIYLVDCTNSVEGLIFLFYSLFGELKNEITIYKKSWWDFCLDIWNSDTDEYNYEIEGKSEETKNYLKLLTESEINVGYSGSCKCTNWETYLTIVLNCIVTHQAPYSPLLYNVENNFFFYFHYSGSIGFYYQNENKVIKRILDLASKEYEIKV